MLTLYINTLPIFSQSLLYHTMSTVEEIMANLLEFLENSNGCNKCDYQAATKYDLTTHKQAKHNTIKYNCAKC